MKSATILQSVLLRVLSVFKFVRLHDLNQIVLAKRKKLTSEQKLLINCDADQNLLIKLLQMINIYDTIFIVSCDVDQRYDHPECCSTIQFYYTKIKKNIHNLPFQESAKLFFK